MKKTSAKRREVGSDSPASKDWSISRKRFVLFPAMTLSFLSEKKKTDWLNWQSVFYRLFFSLVLSFCQNFCLSFLLMGFPHFLLPPFPVLALSPSAVPCSLFLSVCLSPSEGRLSPEAHRTDWRLTLAVVLFMEAENYTVTFPAFLLEISNRSGLSIQDRDPGGGETGCCCNHFLPHHFLQVD